MHATQDLILTIGSLVFAVALVPSIISPHKPALSTSIANSLVLFVFAGTYITLNLWLAAAAATLTGLLWTTLALQKLRQTKQ